VNNIIDLFEQNQPKRVLVAKEIMKELQHSSVKSSLKFLQALGRVELIA